MIRIALVLCCVLGTAAAEPDVPTDQPPEPPDQAKKLDRLDTSKIEALFDQGTKQYDTGQWDAAIESFRQAYALMPDPSFLFNIGQAYRQKGACRDATAAYKAYLRNATDDNRAKVEAFVKELEPCVKIEEENARRLLPPPPPPPAVPVGPTWPRALRWTGYAVGGLGVALVGAGAVFSLKARDADRDFERECANGCEAGARLDQIERRGEDAERNAKIFYIAGGVVVAGGVVLWVIGHRAEERFAVTPVAGGAMAMTRWTF